MTIWQRGVTLVGGLALLGATAIDVVAVIGRNIDIPVRGSIELVQVCVLVAGSLALLVATAARGHASVRILVDRMGPGTRDVLERLSALLAAVFFAALLAGSAWLAIDLWSAHESSEVLGVPWRWMRLFANVVLVATLAVLLRQIAASRTADRP